MDRRVELPISEKVKISVATSTSTTAASMLEGASTWTFREASHRLHRPSGCGRHACAVQPHVRALSGAPREGSMTLDGENILKSKVESR